MYLSKYTLFIICAYKNCSSYRQTPPPLTCLCYPLKKLISSTHEAVLQLLQVVVGGFSVAADLKCRTRYTDASSRPVLELVHLLENERLEKQLNETEASRENTGTKRSWLTD